MYKISLLLFLVIFFMNANIASACMCAGNLPSLEALQESSAVFAGRVTNIETPVGLLMSSADSVRVTLEISRSWKGTPYKTLVLTTSRSESSCGYSFREGEDYIVYAYGEENKLGTDICSRTSLFSDAQEDLLVLGKGTVPNIEGSNLQSQSNFQQITWIVAGVLVLGSVFLISRKYRK